MIGWKKAAEHLQRVAYPVLRWRGDASRNKCASVSITIGDMVASDGLEPSRSNRAADFKSAVSTNSTTRPRRKALL